MGGVWYGMVKKSRESFWCFKGHGAEFFSLRCHLEKSVSSCEIDCPHETLFVFLLLYYLYYLYPGTWYLGI